MKSNCSSGRKEIIIIMPCTVVVKVQIPPNESIKFTTLIVIINKRMLKIRAVVRTRLHGRFLQRKNSFGNTGLCACFIWLTGLFHLADMHWESGTTGRREETSGLASRTHIRTQKKDWGRGRGGVHGRLWFVRSFWEEVNMDQAVKQTGGHRVGKESMSGSSDVGSSSFLWKVEQSSSNLGVPLSLTRYHFFFPAEL